MGVVLVVEDSRTQRKAISKLLKSNGLKVLVAEDGVEALEKVQKSRPDIVVLDIILPQMNGYEVCRRLKSNKEIHKPAIVMCSTKTEEFDRYWGLKQGADAYLSKPFFPEELLNTVKYLLRGTA